jgi:ABC-type Fe3+-hydroxamate transport system substrate-binding protein
MTAYNTYRAAASNKGFFRKAYELALWFGPKNIWWAAPILTFNGLNLSGIWLNNIPSQAGGRNYVSSKPVGNEDMGGH